MIIDKEPNELLKGIEKQKLRWEIAERARADEIFQRTKGFYLGHRDLVDGLSDKHSDIPEATAARLGESIDQAIERIRAEGPLHFPERKN